jgi:nitrilase
LRLPRPCRPLVRSGGSDADQIVIGETMTSNVAHCQCEAVSITHVLAVVVTESLLIEVAEEMKRFDAHIGSVDTALQQRPEVFKAVGVDAPVHIFNGVVHNLVRVGSGESFVGQQGVGVESRTRFHMLLDFSLESGFLAVRNYGRYDLAATLQDAHYSRLILRAGAGDTAGFLRKMHVAGFATDEGFVGFDFARELCNGAVMHYGADAMEHVPCRLLSDADRAGEFAGANTVLAVAEQPESTHPLIKSKGAILEDGSNLEAELFLASVAFPDAASFDEGVLLRTASRATYNTIRKPQIEGALESTVGIAEVDNGILQRVGRIHESNLRSFFTCVKYVVALKRVEESCRIASKGGASLIVFPEALLGGYPKGLDFGATIGNRTEEGRQLFARYSFNAIHCPGPETETLEKWSRVLSLYIVIGVIERDLSTLYCSTLLFSPADGLIAKHRKLMPTGSERLIWGQGDGTTMQVVETSIGRIGMAICWENYMPLYRQYLYNHGVQIWCAPTVDMREMWQVSMRHIAYEGRCFVLSACQNLEKTDWPSDMQSTAGTIEGRSVIVSPRGEVIAGPTAGSGVLFAEIDLDDVQRGKFDLDVAGHYSRPDVFSFHRR